MKFFVKTIAVLSLLFLIACGSDSEPSGSSCTEDDFVSRWRGDVVCDSSSVDFMGFEFTQDAGGDIAFDYFNVTEFGDYVVSITGCNFTAESSGQNVNGFVHTISVEGSLNNNTIESTITRTIGGDFDFRCTGSTFEKY